MCKNDVQKSFFSQTENSNMCTFYANSVEHMNLFFFNVYSDTFSDRTEIEPAFSVDPRTLIDQIKCPSGLNNCVVNQQGADSVTQLKSPFGTREAENSIPFVSRSALLL